ncbi:hypothetical protein F53441_8006 [Fusarium austroafricanum]|uniref:DUF2406 domain-containing protein n=1 Tax=Fusarium austroafricanum TaxID=2364996 RepID=A0A8H4KDS1_9HYPO|nr:hypothetical protein F53441_8006 [Fusarium austroafricanum]
MATSTKQYRQYPPPPSTYPAQDYQQQDYQKQQYQQTIPTSPRKGSQNPPAHNRTFSFHSQKSHKSSGSKDLQETHAEKEAKRLHSKADPTLAISEAEPSAVAAMMTESSFAPLRSMQHKDAYGNSIADPDKSNPTRNRWERPLDTIRSFEAAIDGGYSRKSLYRAETDSQANWNRRNSSYTNQPRFPRENYYNDRPASFRPENQYDNGSSRNNYFDGQAYSNGYGAGPSRQRMSRMQSEPQYQPGHDQNIYPLPHKDRSYETVTSAAGSGNSDHAGYQTDPTSSDNSSIDRTVPAKRREPFNEYASASYQSQPAYQSRPWPASGMNSDGGQPQVPPPSHAQPSATQTQAPAPPQKQKNTLLRRTSTQQSAQQPQQTAGGDKRKSWFSRRFSKNS